MEKLDRQVGCFGVRAWVRTKTPFHEDNITDRQVEYNSVQTWVRTLNNILEDIQYFLLNYKD